MARIGREDVSNLSYRKEFLGEELNKIRDTVNGRGESYLPYITDENGRITDEKIEGLIYDLIDALKQYKNVRFSTGNSLAAETEELYRCFLYCTILGIAWGGNFCFETFLYGEFGQAQTFADIVNMAKDPETVSIDRRDTLYLRENDAFASWYLLEGGFFGYADEVYYMITGHSVYDTYSDEEKARVDKYKSDVLEDIKQSAPLEQEWLENMGFATMEEYDEFLEDKAEKEEIPDEELEELARQEQELEEKGNQRARELVDRMPDPDRYIRRYIRYRELYFERGHSSLPQDIEDMVDVWLYEHGVSPFSMGDAYGLVSHRLKQFPNMLKAEIRKARKMK